MEVDQSFKMAQLCLKVGMVIMLMMLMVKFGFDMSCLSFHFESLRRLLYVDMLLAATGG